MGQFVHTGKKRHAYSVLVVRPEGKRTLGSLGRSWKDKIMVHIKEIFWEDVAQDREIGGFF